MTSVAVVGATGYTGGELIKILINHPMIDNDDITLFSKKGAGKTISSIHRSLYTIFDKKIENLDLGKIDSNIVFFATPVGKWLNRVPNLLDSGIKVISLCGKYRISDAEIDKEWYDGVKTNVELLEESVYGLPELFRDKISKARFVANPGCYPTSVILGLAPLKVFKDKLDLNKVVVDSMSGVTGAGKHPKSINLSFSEVENNVIPYNVANHRHTPEMEYILGKHFDDKIEVSFSPSIIPVTRGIVSRINVFTDEIGEVDLASHFQQYYKDEFFVRITNNKDGPSLDDVVNTNFCDIQPFGNRQDSISVISMLDNLLKGGSGQAVQNMNIMFGFDERTGLPISRRTAHRFSSLKTAVPVRGT